MFDPEERKRGLVQRSVSKTSGQGADAKYEKREQAFQLRNKKIYDHDKHSDDEDDEYIDHIPPDFVSKNLTKKKRIHPLYNETNAYIALVVVVLIVVLFSFRMKKYEMHQLRETHGQEARKPTTSHAWWHNALLYHIYPRSFQDSNDDGVGDFNGIRQRLDHLAGLSITGVILNSIHHAPGADSDRGVMDFMHVDPLLGTIEDFKNLLKELKKNGMHLIIEFIVNHTSNLHRWFLESQKGGKENKYANYYIWHPGKVLPDGSHAPPNNWLSRYGGSMWTWDDKRQEYYLHQYGSNMPDLNHRNKYVREEFINIFQYWLELGVDGIYLEGVQALFEVDDLLLDEPESEKEGVPPGHWMYLDHPYTDDQPEIHEFLATWREQLDAYNHKHKRKVFLGVEVVDESVKDILYYYITGADAPMSLILADLASSCDGYCLHEMVDRWLIELPEGKSSFWQVSNHEMGRMSSRKGNHFKGVIAMLQLLLPGGAVIYYGDEIGMEHHVMSPSDKIDGQHFTHFTHNGSRTPMQWNAKKNAGFSNADNTWLPVYEDYPRINVQTELSNSEKGYTKTTLQFYQCLIRLRSLHAFMYGRMQYVITNDKTFSFMRFVRDEDSFLMVMNFGDEEVVEDFFTHVGVDQGRITCHTPGLTPRGSLGVNSVVILSSLRLAPGEGMVVTALGAICMPGLLGFVRRFGIMAAQYKAGDFSMAFITVPNIEAGKKLAKGLVEKKLAACVNIIPSITSVYEWEGKIEEDSELLLMVKTRTNRVDEVSKFVRENHPFDVAEVISSPIENGNAPYLEWLDKVVPGKSSD